MKYEQKLNTVYVTILPKHVLGSTVLNAAYCLIPINYVIELHSKQ